MFILINLWQYIILIYSMFFIGIFGIIFNRKEILFMLLALELIFFSISLGIILLGVYLGQGICNFYSVIILTFAAIDSVIGLSILSRYNRLRGNITVAKMRRLKG